MSRSTRRTGGGVSWQQVGPDRFKLAWRQWEAIEDAPSGEAIAGKVERRMVDGKLSWSKRFQRYQTVVGAQTRDVLAAEIRLQLATKGYYTPAARPEDAFCNLEEAFAAWMRHKHGRGVRMATLDVYASVFTRFFRTVRKVHGIRADAVVRADTLTRDTLDRAQALWRREGLSDVRRYDLARVVYEAWRWASDDPDRWPGIPVPPRDGSTILPNPPVRVGPPPAATWEEMDAVIRRARETSRSPDLWMVLAVQRCTGLRIGQVLGIRAGAVDLRTRTLRVEIGKSRRETAEQRVVPLSAEVLSLLKPRVTALSAGQLVFAARDGTARKPPSPALGELFQEASKAGEIRDATWRPVGRHPRTSHWFRAGFQTQLSVQGVPDAVIKALVGHTDGSTMRTHYVSVHDSLSVAMRRAVDGIPPIRWDDEVGGEVVPLRRAE